MTTALVSSIETYAFTASDRLFLDANVWLMIEPPQFRTPRVDDAKYTRAFKAMLEGKSKIFVDAIVLSEIVNRWLRDIWNAVDPTRSTYASFKHFRRGPDCRRPAKDLSAACNRILRHSDRVDTAFRALDLDEILSNVEAGTRDFNDGVIEATCDGRKLTLVTDDADFRGARPRVLTANPRLLRR